MLDFFQHQWKKTRDRPFCVATALVPSLEQDKSDV
jgi:hypothetical protein